MELAWLFSSKAPTIVLGQVFRFINWQPPHREGIYRLIIPNVCQIFFLLFFSFCQCIFSPSDYPFSIFKHLCVFLSFTFSHCHFLSFFELRILINVLVFSNFSYLKKNCYYISLITLAWKPICKIHHFRTHFDLNHIFRSFSISKKTAYMVTQEFVNIMYILRLFDSFNFNVIIFQNVHVQIIRLVMHRKCNETMVNTNGYLCQWRNIYGWIEI